MKKHRILSSSRAHGDDAWVGRTMLVRHSQQRRSDIDVHKWYESEKAGCDIGWDRAAISYTLHQVMLRAD